MATTPASTELGGPGRPVGVNTVLFSPFSLEEAVQRAAACGYDGVELAALKGMCEHLELDRWPEQVEQVRDLAGTAGLRLLSMEEASLEPTRLEKALAAAEALGIGVVNVGPGGRSEDPEALGRTIDSLREGVKRAADHGVRLCVKAHVGAAMFNTPTTLQVLDAIPEQTLGVDVDPSHLYRSGEDPAQAVKAVLPRVHHVHIRDCPAGSGGPGPIAAQACGRGDMDLLGFCRVLVDGNYQGPVCLEVIGAKPEHSLADLVTVAAASRGYLAAAFTALTGAGAATS